MTKIALTLFATAVLAWPQHHHGNDAATPAALMDGLGSHTHPIKTKSAMAQQFFDQGLALVYGFNHDEAGRMFARASELDPASPHLSPDDCIAALQPSPVYASPAKVDLLS